METYDSAFTNSVICEGCRAIGKQDRLSEIDIKQVTFAA